MADADPALQANLDAELAAVEAASERKARRKKMLLGIAAVVALGAAAWGAWYALVGSHVISTDNAYVGADTASVTPMIAAQVASVEVSDTQVVKAGQVLVRLDDADARIALAEAEAELAKARRQYGQTAATSAALAAQVSMRSADITRARAQLTAAEADFAKAGVDLDRRRKLAPGGAVSGEELTSATNAYAAARANLELARAGVAQASAGRGAASGQLAANDALVQGVSQSGAPDVLAAQARVDQARLNLARTVIRAPIDGIVTRRNVQSGQRVAPGTALMLVVPAGQLYVDANFKEGQLGRVRAGQRVTLTSDLYGSDVEFRGTVVGLSGGTGSSFALIPAQNATGNWIKVVQRLPVRIALDPAQLKQHPLRVGLSMDAEIDITAN